MFKFSLCLELQLSEVTLVSLRVFTSLALKRLNYLAYYYFKGFRKERYLSLFRCTEKIHVGTFCAGGLVDKPHPIYSRNCIQLKYYTKSYRESSGFRVYVKTLNSIPADSKTK